MGAKSLINAAVSAFVGVIIFSVVQNFINDQCTAGWDPGAITMINVIPIIIALSIIVGLFAGLTKLDGV
jgi:uncharacterized membrane protein